MVTLGVRLQKIGRGIQGSLGNPSCFSLRGILVLAGAALRSRIQQTNGSRGGQ
jgi:hypothetical protein